MTRLRLECSPEEARELVRQALRRTTNISEIEEGAHQVVGKTGISFPRVLWSYGENIYVDFSDPTDEGEVPIEVWAEKSVWANITADPQKFKREFLTELEAVRERPIEEHREESIDLDQGHSSSNWLLGAIGYPIAMIIGGFIGVVFSLAFTTTVFKSLNDSVGLLGILVGSVAGGVVWYHRDNSTVKLAGKYVGVTFIGIILAGIIQTALNLYGNVGSVLFLMILLGSPLSLYAYTNSTRD